MQLRPVFNEWSDEFSHGACTSDERMGFWRTQDCPLPIQLFDAVREWCSYTEAYTAAWTENHKINDAPYWHTEMANVSALAVAHGRVGHLALCEAYVERKRRIEVKDATNGRGDLYASMPAKNPQDAEYDYCAEAKWARPKTSTGACNSTITAIEGTWDSAITDAESLLPGKGFARLAMLFITPQARRPSDAMKAFDLLWDSLALKRCTTYAWWRAPSGHAAPQDGECVWPGVMMCMAEVKRRRS